MTDPYNELTDAQAIAELERLRIKHPSIIAKLTTKEVVERTTKMKPADQLLLAQQLVRGAELVINDNGVGFYYGGRR